MGLFTGLLTLPLAPVRGVAWVLEQVVDEADRQLYDEHSIRRELLELEFRYDEGAITAEERTELEEELLGRLAESQLRNRALEQDRWDG